MEFFLGDYFLLARPVYSLPSIFIAGCGESPSPPGSTPL